MPHWAAIKSRPRTGQQAQKWETNRSCHPQRADPRAQSIDHLFLVSSTDYSWSLKIPFAFLASSVNCSFPPLTLHKMRSLSTHWKHRSVWRVHQQQWKQQACLVWLPSILKNLTAYHPAALDSGHTSPLFIRRTLPVTQLLTLCRLRFGSLAIYGGTIFLPRSSSHPSFRS